MTKKQAEVIYDWSNKPYAEGEIDPPEMLELMELLFQMMRNNEPMSADEASKICEWGWACNSNFLEAESRDQLFRLILHELVDTVEPYKIEGLIGVATDSKEEVELYLKEIEPDTEPIPTSYPTEPKVIYTGGGIWLSALETSDRYYYAISTEDEEPGLAMFDRKGEDDETEHENFPCQNMIACPMWDEMSPAERSIYRRLKSALDREAF